MVYSRSVEIGKAFRVFLVRFIKKEFSNMVITRLLD
jgi:hypothetical protein